jgi:hypothetical protein
VRRFRPMQADGERAMHSALRNLDKATGHFLTASAGRVTLRHDPVLVERSLGVDRQRMSQGELP